MSETDKKPQLQLTKKNGLIVVAIIAAGLAFTLLNTGDKEPEKVEVAVKPIEIGSDPVNNISVKDKEASLTVFAKNFETIDQKLLLQQKETAEREASLRKEIKDSTNTLKAQVAALSDDIIAFRASGVDAAYKDANKNDSKTIQTPPAMPDKMPDMSMEGGLNFDGLNFNMDAPKPQQQAQGPQKNAMYGPNYFILKPDNFGATVSKKSGGDSLNASESDLFSSMSTPAAQSNNFNDQNSGRGQQAPAQGQANAEPQQQYESAAEAYKAQTQNAQNGNGQTNTGPKMEKITIPAFSFVEVTTLHGVACPIGANSPNSKSQSEIPARPIVLPVRGVFRGPNGATVDVGNIHLMGLCSGRRTSSENSGRATIRVEQMSYWDEGGDSQMSRSPGYIVDSRDNEQDVYGRLDEASGQTLARESMAAAGAAFSAALSQSEYTTSSNLDSNGSTSVQQLTGSATKAATTQGIAAIFTKLADRFQQQANAAIDTVVVEPGIRLRFVTEQPINIYKPAEAFDIDAGKSDVLL
uniref:Conjugal transfer protein TraB n=1 Tax=Pseudomonas fluorescens (strain SBW25) TaxID=216595 RepID=A0A0G4E5B6_PSEFS|nr:conjugal transfer protein TraB [Pseudomonas fluorescens]CEK42162.1 hypothetical protein PQBR57_0209 [Pseudomonas fluorescens SBW25]